MTDEVVDILVQIARSSRGYRAEVHFNLLKETETVNPVPLDQLFVYLEGCILKREHPKRIPSVGIQCRPALDQRECQKIHAFSESLRIRLLELGSHQN